jgi:hypothetical protein
VVIFFLSQKQKPPSLWAGGFRRILGLSLAGPVRQQAGEIKEEKAGPLLHREGFKHD